MSKRGLVAMICVVGLTAVALVARAVSNEPRNENELSVKEVMKLPSHESTVSCLPAALATQNGATLYLLTYPGGATLECVRGEDQELTGLVTLDAVTLMELGRTVREAGYAIEVRRFERREPLARLGRGTPWAWARPGIRMESNGRSMTITLGSEGDPATFELDGPAMQRLLVGVMVGQTIIS